MDPLALLEGRGPLEGLEREESLGGRAPGGRGPRGRGPGGRGGS